MTNYERQMMSENFKITYLGRGGTPYLRKPDNVPERTAGVVDLKPLLSALENLEFYEGSYETINNSEQFVAVNWRDFETIISELRQAARGHSL